MNQGQKPCCLPLFGTGDINLIQKHSLVLVLIKKEALCVFESLSEGKILWGVQSHLDLSSLSCALMCLAI